jgi:hypothetical protein
MNILKKNSCPSLSGRSKLTYVIGSDDNGALFIRIAENTGGGFHSGEWVAVKDIEAALNKSPESITSLTLFKLFKGKSVNTPAFLLAALKAEGVVEAVKGRQRKHTLVDIGKLGQAATAPKKAQPKKVSAKKTAAKKATPNKA